MQICAEIVVLTGVIVYLAFGSENRHPTRQNNEFSHKYVIYFFHLWENAIILTWTVAFVFVSKNVVTISCIPDWAPPFHTWKLLDSPSAKKNILTLVSSLNFARIFSLLALNRKYGLVPTSVFNYRRSSKFEPLVWRFPMGGAQ